METLIPPEIASISATQNLPWSVAPISRAEHDQRTMARTCWPRATRSCLRRRDISRRTPRMWSSPPVAPTRSSPSVSQSARTYKRGPSPQEAWSSPASVDQDDYKTGGTPATEGKRSLRKPVTISTSRASLCVAATGQQRPRCTRSGSRWGAQLAESVAGIVHAGGHHLPRSDLRCISWRIGRHQVAH